MARYKEFRQPRTNNAKTIPFDNAEEAWFWFIMAQQARIDGARFTNGETLVPRPCEPVDILKILDGLYRRRKLLRDHLLVLRHYGRRNMPPDPRRVKEVRASVLWAEAMEALEPELIRKGIITNAKGWARRHLESMQMDFFNHNNADNERMAAE